MPFEHLADHLTSFFSLGHTALATDLVSSGSGDWHGSGHTAEAPVAFAEHSSAGAQDAPVSTDGPALDPELKKLSGGAVHIDLMNNNNSQYYGDFTIGNPKQRFTAVFDTGSGTTWVPGDKCQSDTCAEHHRFLADKSPSFKTADGNNEGQIKYGTGEVKYHKGHDTLTFCDSHDNAGCHGVNSHQLKIPDQPLGISKMQTSYPFRVLPFDGILGLAPSGSTGSVLHQLKASHALPRNVLGVYLSNDPHRSGSMDFGGVDTSHIAPGSEPHWHKIGNKAEWVLGMKDVLVDGKPLHLCDKRPGGVCPAVVDTGSSLVTGPSSEIGPLLNKISLDQGCKDLESMPTITLQFVDRDGKIVDYPLTPEEYTLRSAEEVPQTGDSEFFKNFPLLGKGKAPDMASHCDPGVGVMDTAGKKWVIGDTFLRRYYSIFDDDRGLVGFVRSIHPSDAPQDAGSAVSVSQVADVSKASAPFPLLPLPLPGPRAKASAPMLELRRQSRAAFL